jgi:HSP20 family protein
MPEKITSAQAAPAPQQTGTPVPVKAIEPMDIFRRFEDVYGAIARRAFEIFETNGGVFGRDVDDWLKAEAELLHPAHVRVCEADGAVTVEAEVPGFDAKDLEISLEPRRVTIRGQRETKEEKTKGTAVYRERCSNQILRVVDLPAEVDASKAIATLKNGLLELQVPKGVKSKVTRIGVKTA